MARSVILGITSACIALAVTASIATPSQAMSFSDYDNSASAAVLGDRADINELFSGRLLSEQKRRLQYDEALEEIRAGRDINSLFEIEQPELNDQRPLSLTLPF